MYEGRKKQFVAEFDALLLPGGAGRDPAAAVALLVLHVQGGRQDTVVLEEKVEDLLEIFAGHETLAHRGVSAQVQTLAQVQPQGPVSRELIRAFDDLGEHIFVHTRAHGHQVRGLESGALEQVFSRHAALPGQVDQDQGVLGRCCRVLYGHI